MAGIGWAPLGGEWWTWRWCSPKLPARLGNGGRGDGAAQNCQRGSSTHGSRSSPRRGPRPTSSSLPHSQHPFLCIQRLDLARRPHRATMLTSIRTGLAHPWPPLHPAASINLQASGTVQPNASVPGLSTSHENNLVSLPILPALLACRRPAGAPRRPRAPRGAPPRAAAADGGGWTAAVCAAAQAAVARHPRRSPRAPPAQEVVAGRPPSTSAQSPATAGSAQAQA
jgi:hypothetical protein